MQPERRDLSLLTAGTLISVAGDSAAMVALLLELRPHGVGWISAALAAELLPTVLLAWYSGRVVDRVDNRRLLVVSLAGQAAVAVPLAYARSPWLVVALFFALNGVATLVRPASSAMVPVLSGGIGATKGFAWVSTGSGIGWIVGPALGGVLTSAFGVTTAILADAGSFVAIAVACGLLSATRRREPPEGVGGRPHGGLRILRRDGLLWWSLVATAVSVACAVVDNVAAPFRFVDQLATSSLGYGSYLALWGVGALAGAQLPRRVPPTALPAALATGNCLSGVGIVGIGLAPSLAIALVASAVGGIGNGIANVSMPGLVSDRIRSDEHGRAFAATSAVVQTGVGVGTVTGAPLTAALGAGNAMTAAGGLAATLSALTLAWTLRRPRRA
jgi:MFS family permease